MFLQCQMNFSQNTYALSGGEVFAEVVKVWFKGDPYFHKPFIFSIVLVINNYVKLLNNALHSK